MTLVISGGYVYEDAPHYPPRMLGSVEEIADVAVKSGLVVKKEDHDKTMDELKKLTRDAAELNAAAIKLLDTLHGIPANNSQWAAFKRLAVAISTMNQHDGVHEIACELTRPGEQAPLHLSVEGGKIHVGPSPFVKGTVELYCDNGKNTHLCFDLSPERARDLGVALLEQAVDASERA